MLPLHKIVIYLVTILLKIGNTISSIFTEYVLDSNPSRV